MDSLQIPHSVWTSAAAAVALGAFVLGEHWTQPASHSDDGQPPVYVIEDSSSTPGFKLLASGPQLPEFNPGYAEADIVADMPDFSDLSYILQQDSTVTGPDLGIDLTTLLNEEVEDAPPPIHDTGDASAPASPVENNGDTSSTASAPTLSSPSSDDSGGLAFDAQIARGVVSTPEPITAQAVPEPGSTALLAGGIMALLAGLKMRGRR